MMGMLLSEYIDKLRDVCKARKMIAFKYTLFPIL